jgi:RNA recognition motif-containing protein
MYKDHTSRSLYVGNLAPQVTDELLREIFQIIGPVEVAKTIKDRLTGQPSGFGFIDYYDAPTAAYALEKMNGKILYQQELKVNWATASGQKEDTSGHHHIFIGDLSPEVDDKVLYDAFKPFGTISEARIMRDQNTNRSKGYGFVAFRIREDAERALREMNGEWLGGRAIRCNWANQKNKGVSAGPGDLQMISQLTAPTNTTVYVGNLGSDVSDSMLQQAFQDFGTIEEIRVQREKGFAFIRFNTHDAATRAIAFVNGRQIGSKPVKCSWGKESGGGAVGGMPPGAGYMGGPPMGYFPPPGGFAPPY